MKERNLRATPQLSLRDAGTGATLGLFGVDAWRRCVLDEAHTIRNRKTQAYKSVMAIAEKAEIRWAATGSCWGARTRRARPTAGRSAGGGGPARPL